MATDFDSLFLDSPPPWGDRPSIYRTIRSGDGAPGSLPDDDKVFQPGGLRWVAGGQDGVMRYHGAGPKGDPSYLVFELLRDAVLLPSAETVARLYEELLKHRALAFLDSLMRQVTYGLSDLNAWQVLNWARWQVVEAADREPLKICIGVLGIFGTPDDLDTIVTLGRHDEFTLYSLRAIRRLLPESRECLWQLARDVHGWGRIHLVERLSKKPSDRLREWLLHEGYKNDVMAEYVALRCARVGRLDQALEADQISTLLFDTASDLVRHILPFGGPFPNLSDWKRGLYVIEEYLRHAQAMAITLSHLSTLQELESFLTQEDRDWSDLVELGWTQGARQKFLAQIAILVGRPEWRERAHAGLESRDRGVFSEARAVAEALGIDVWPRIFERLKAGAELWAYAMSTPSPERAEQVIALAADRLPLSEIASGPADELGLGPKFDAHRWLDAILQELARFPGLGMSLVAAGLRSPVTRNRNLAIRVLDAWGSDSWPNETRALLAACLKLEPNSVLKEQMGRLLESDPDT